VHPFAVVTVMVPVPPVAAMFAEVGDIEYVQLVV